MALEVNVNANAGMYADMQRTQYAGNNNTSNTQVQADTLAQQAANQSQIVIEADAKNQTGEKGTNQSAINNQIEAALKAANAKARFGNTNAQFTYHEKTKRVSIKIFDKETNELIREIPPEETLEMISKMWELAGLLVDEKR